MIQKFDQWCKMNELISQSSSKELEKGTEPYNYSYGNIQDILGNKYNFSVNTQKLKEFEMNVLRKDETPNKDDEYFAKRFIEFRRNNWRLTPPYQEDLINNSDYYARSFYDETARNSQNDTGKSIKGLQEHKLNEDGVSGANVSVSGMGAVVTSQPSNIVGDVSGATTGSGDIGSGWKDVNNMNRNVIKRPNGSRREKKFKAKAKEMLKNFSNSFKGNEYKQGGDKKSSIMSFSEFSKK